MIIQDGLGSGLPPSALISSTVATAGSIVAIPAIAASLLTTLGLSLSIVPFVGPIIAGVALAIGALGIGNGCGQTCIVASQDADKIEPIMKQNVKAAQDQATANGGCLNATEKATAVQNFNDLWGALSNACSDPGLSDAGKRCISDRQRGGKWDWFSYYLDPITAIPTCAVTSAANLTNLISSPYVLLGGLALAAFMFSGDDK